MVPPGVTRYRGGVTRSTARADLIIVGAGLAGSAAAWAAAARGMSVVVVEAFEAGHKRGSSHGSARIFRHAYADPLYVKLMKDALRRWEQLQDEAGEQFLQFTGGLDYGPLRDPEGLHAVLASCGVPADLLRAEEAAERWPASPSTPGSAPPGPAPPRAAWSCTTPEPGCSTPAT